MVFSPATDEEVEKIFSTVINGGTVTQEEADKYKTAIMLHLGKEYAKKGIVMQLHYGAQRNTNTKMFERLGPDTGFDCISVKDCGEKITGFLNALEMDRVAGFHLLIYSVKFIPHKSKISNFRICIQ